MNLRRGLNRVYVALALVWALDVFVGAPVRESLGWTRKIEAEVSAMERYAVEHASDSQTAEGRAATLMRVETGERKIAEYGHHAGLSAAYSRKFQVWWVPFVWAILPPIILYIPLRISGEMIAWIVRGFIASPKPTAGAT